jgi:NAD(P)-dependent dehydrogenase (short-subunit alcohol dehydrogenase family)
MKRFEGKTAVLTGGASGIGRAAAERLAREGARVLVADLDADAGAILREELRSQGLEADFIAADVTREGDCKAAVDQAVSQWGRLDVLINSAGLGEGATVAALEEAVWDRVVDANMKGVYLPCKAAFPVMKEQVSGSIVNVASLAGLLGGFGMGAYASSKAGAIQLTKVLAAEGAPHKIRANCVCPAWTETPMLERFFTGTGVASFARRRLQAMMPLGRFAQPEEIAAAILFLASDEAAMITGVALPIDGGLLVT